MAVMMMATGCSKSEESMEESKAGITLQDLTGVWRSGDYFVSFSADGYVAAHLGSQHLVTDDLVVGDEENFFYAIGGFSGGEYAQFMINDFDGKQMTCHVKLRDGMEGAYTVSEKDMAFTKSADTPVGRTNVLVGKTFSYASSYGLYSGETISGQCSGTFIDHRRIRRQTTPDRDGVEPMYYLDHYAYLPPYIYYIENFDYWEHQPIYHVTAIPPQDVLKRRVTINTDGTVTFSE